MVLHFLYLSCIDSILTDILRNISNLGGRIQEGISDRLDLTGHWFDKAHNF